MLGCCIENNLFQAEITDQDYINAKNNKLMKKILLLSHC